MAGFLSLYTETERIEFHDGKFWIEIKKFLTLNDTEAADKARFPNRFTDSGLQGKVDPEAYQRKIVSRAIVDWNLTDDNGDILPHGRGYDKANKFDRDYTEESLQLLPTGVFGRIYKRVNDLNKMENADLEAGTTEARFHPVDGVGNPNGDAAVTSATGDVAVLAGTGAVEESGIEAGGYSGDAGVAGEAISDDNPGNQ